MDKVFSTTYHIRVNNGEWYDMIITQSLVDARVIDIASNIEESNEIS